jgi:hypothetical protein
MAGAPKIPKSGGWANSPVKGTSTHKSKGGAGFDRSAMRGSGGGRTSKAQQAANRSVHLPGGGAMARQRLVESRKGGGGGRSYHRDSKGRFA